MKRQKVKQVKTDTKNPTTQTAAAPTTEAKPAKIQRIKVLKKDAKFRGATAREAWFARLVEYDGKPLDEFLENTKEKPPSRTKNGAAEPPSGWVRFFERSGVLSLQAS